MAQPLEQSEAKITPKPDTIKVNIASNESKNIKMNVKLKWTVLQLKEHLYNYNYFQSAPFNQIISLHGTDLRNTQTFEQIYDVITNKGSTDILRSLRGKLTWDPDDININEIIKENDDENEDDDDSKQSKLPITPSIHEISLYIRAKRTPKRILATLTSDEPMIQEFVVDQHRESVVTIRTPCSDTTDSSSSSSSRGYRASTFDPNAIRKKQERKALKKLRKTFSPKSPNIPFIETPEDIEQDIQQDIQQDIKQDIEHDTEQVRHIPSGSVVFHKLDEESSTEPSHSNTQSVSRSRSSSQNTNDSSSLPPDEAPIDDDEKQQVEVAKSHRRGRSLYVDISSKALSNRDDVESDDENEAELTQENLYMHTTGEHGPVFHRGKRSLSRMSSIGSWAGSTGSVDWGGGPFIVRRMSIGSGSSGLPSNLGLYHAAHSSNYIWESDLPDYYDDIPDSLQRLHSKLEMKAQSKRGSRIEPVDELKELQTKVDDPEPQRQSVVRFSEHIVYKSEEILDDEDKKEEDKEEKVDEEEEVDVENVNKWQIKEVGVDSKYIAGMDRLKGDIKENEEEEEEESTESTEDDDGRSDDNQINDYSSHSTSRSNGIYDEVVVEEDKLQRELTWKTSYKGIWLIGMVWLGAFHCLYSFSAIVSNVVATLDVKLFEFGLMYSFNFIGVGIGLFISSYLLNKPQWIHSSQNVSKHSIFIVLLCQLVAVIIFVYEYVIESDSSPDALLWFILVFSRFIMGIAIGFVESSVNNLVFEWFSDDAFNAKLSSLSADSDVNKEYLASLSSRVLSYCMFLKEFGHISARLFLVPMIYIFAFNDNTNLFVPLLVGVIISLLAWIGMIYASYRDNKYINIPKRQYMYNEEAQASDNDSESTPLLGGDRNRISASNIPEDWSYADWYEMGLIGLNRSVILSIAFLSINFGISFSFTILSITDLCQQYLYSDLTANILICFIPITTLFGSNWLRRNILSKINSIWTVMFIGCCLFAIVFALFAFSGLSAPNDSAATLLPIFCVILFILGSECAFASGYELLLSSAPEYIHGLISGLNSTTNFIVSGLFILIFSVLVIDYSAMDINIVHEYRWAYAFLCFTSIINLIIAITLRYSFGANVNALQHVQSISQ